MKKYITAETNSVYQSITDITNEAYENLYHTIVIDKNGFVVYISNYYADFLGKTKEEIIGKKIETVIPNTKLYETLQTGEPTFDSLFEFMDGRSLVYSRVPVRNTFGEVIGVVSISSLNTTDTVNALYKEINHLKMANKMYSQQLLGLTEAPSVFDNIIGVSPQIMEIKQILSKVSNSTMPILLTGESGVGKEVFANAIHNGSERKDAPFVKVNCAAIPRELLESELFGYETGTFSGAIKGGKAGKFELANNGTILLDEIEELPLEMQSKLLRVLQEYEVERIGSIKPISLNLQVICCSNKNLYKMVEEKKFREDLLYRINVMEIEIPPLRERPEDIPPLCSSLIEKINHKYKLNISGISPEALEYLTGYSWPGNIRELEHSIERACVLIGSGLLCEENFAFIEKKKERSPIQPAPAPSSNFFTNKGTAEKEIIEDALKTCSGNKVKAAKLLGISRSLLYAKIKKYGIQ